MFKLELSSHLQPVVCLTLGQLETLGPTHSSVSATVEPRKCRHLCFVEVEATHQICQIPGCPSRLALLYPALLNALHRKVTLNCFVLCPTAVLSKCPCFWYVRVLLPKDKAKWVRSILPWPLSHRDTPQLSQQTEAGQLSSFLHPQVCMQPSRPGTTLGAKGHQCPCPQWARLNWRRLL